MHIKKKIPIQSIMALFLALLISICFCFFSKNAEIIVYMMFFTISAWVVYTFGNIDILSPITLTFIMYLFFIALGPLAFYLNNVRLDVFYLWLIATCWSVIYLGYSLTNILDRRIPKVRKYLRLNENNAHTIIWVCECIVCVSILFRLFFLWSNRSLLSLNIIASGRIEAVSGNGLVTHAGSLWIPAAYILIELALKGKRIHKRMWFEIFLALVTSVFTGFRSGIVVFILVAIIMKNKRKKIPMIRVVILGSIILLLLNVYSAIRGGSVLDVSFSVLLQSLLMDNAQNGVVNLRYIFNAFPDDHEFLKGYGYLINIIMLRPGPDLDFTLTLKEILGLSFVGGGVTPTIIGEFYLNFGLVGTYLGIFVFGVLLAKVNKWMKKTDLYFWPAYILVQLVVSIRSGLANAEISILINYIVYVFVCIFSHEFRLINRYMDK